MDMIAKGFSRGYLDTRNAIEEWETDQYRVKSSGNRARTKD